MGPLLKYLGDTVSVTIILQYTDCDTYIVEEGAQLKSSDMHKKVIGQVRLDRLYKIGPK